MNCIQASFCIRPSHINGCNLCNSIMLRLSCKRNRLNLLPYQFYLYQITFDLLILYHWWRKSLQLRHESFGRIEDETSFSAFYWIYKSPSIIQIDWILILQSIFLFLLVDIQLEKTSLRQVLLFVVVAHSICAGKLWSAL